MAERSRAVEVLIRARDLTATAFGRVRRRLRSLRQTVASITRSFAALTVGVAAAVAGLQRVGAQGSKVIAVQQTFNRITGDGVRALEQLRQATRGTVSDMQLMTSHNQALALGAASSTEEFAKMAEQARILGRAQGIDAATALEKFTVGLARQSRLRLDDLGIVLDQTMANERYAESVGKGADQLTDSEKKIAFRNEALRQADVLVGRLSAGELAGAEAADRFAAAIVNLKDKVATLVAESPAVAEFFDGLTSFVDDWIEIITSDADLIEEAFSSLGRIAANAFSLAVQGAVATPSNVLGSFLQDLEERIASAQGISPAELAERRRQTDEEFRELFPERENVPLGNIQAELEALRSLGRAARSRNELRSRQRGEDEGSEQEREEARAERQARIIADELAAAIERLGDPRPFVPGGIQVPRARADFLRRQAELDPNRIVAPDIGSGLTSFQDPRVRGAFLERQHLEEERAEAEARAVKDAEDAADAMDRARSVGVAALFSTAEAVIAGSQQIEASLIRMIANIVRELPGVGGLAGTLIGGFGGIFAGLVSRRSRREPQEVRVADYSSRALDQLRTRGSGPLRVTTIIEQGGVEIERIERELIERSERDEVTRYGSGGLALRSTRR